MKGEILTVAEFAKRAGISRDGAYKQIKYNRLPAGVKVKKVAGKNFISVSGWANHYQKDKTT